MVKGMDFNTDPPYTEERLKDLASRKQTFMGKELSTQHGGHLKQVCGHEFSNSRSREDSQGLSRTAWSSLDPQQGLEPPFPLSASVNLLFEDPVPSSRFNNRTNSGGISI